MYYRHFNPGELYCDISTDIVITIINHVGSGNGNTRGNTRNEILVNAAIS